MPCVCIVHALPSFSNVFYYVTCRERERCRCRTASIRFRSGLIIALRLLCGCGSVTMTVIVSQIICTKYYAKDSHRASRIAHLSRCSSSKCCRARAHMGEQQQQQPQPKQHIVIIADTLFFSRRARFYFLFVSFACFRRLFQLVFSGAYCVRNDSDRHSENTHTDTRARAPIPGHVFPSMQNV